MSKSYEVVILGSGISGSLLAAVLARNDVRVAVIDSETHPRFAVGEATTPETTTNLKIMGRLFGVPEIEKLSNFFDQRDCVGSSHGIKRGFSFCYHRDHRRHVPAETTQTATLSPPFGPDSHWFRQDTDQYVLTVAARHGADVYQSTTVTDLTFREDGVELSSSRGDFRAQLVVDASGPFSPFARKMGIRDAPTRLATRSRGIFTHMVGVGRYDDEVPAERHGMPYPMDQTTLHHLFDGGWMWVIPFTNHAQATNTLCSVGVMFDSDRFPKTDVSPEEEFEAFLARYPSVAAQFRDAKAVRKWVSSPRIQYSSARLWEGRYFALPHAAAFIDPLFSTGLNLTTHAVNVLGDALVDSFGRGRLEVERLRRLEAQVLRKVAVYDRLVATSFKSFRSFELWNAWFRVWEIGTYFNTLGAMKCILKHEETGDPAFLRARFDETYAAPLAMSVPGYETLFDEMSALVDRVDRGELEEAAAVEAMYRALARFPAMPSFISRRERDVRTMGTFTLERLLRMFVWGKTRGPAATRHYYDFSLGSFGRMILASQRSYRRRRAGAWMQPLWDMVFERSSNEPESRVGSPARGWARSLEIPRSAERIPDAAAAPTPDLEPAAMPLAAGAAAAPTPDLEPAAMPLAAGVAAAR